MCWGSSLCDGDSGRCVEIQRPRDGRLIGRAAIGQNVSGGNSIDPIRGARGHHVKSTSQVPLPAISAPVIVIEESPLLPVKDVAPAQVVCAFTGLARVIPAGRGSVRLSPVIGIAPNC